MPGNLASAAPSGVFPKATYISCREQRQTPMLQNYFKDGYNIRALIADIDGDVVSPVSVRSWELGIRLLAATTASMRTFFEQHVGMQSLSGVSGVIPFYWYDPYDVVPGHAVGSNYDASGLSTQGRHICVFTDNEWKETTHLGRSTMQFNIKSIA